MMQKYFPSWFQRSSYLKKDPRFILLLTEQQISLFFFSRAHQPSLIRLTQTSLDTPASHLLSFLKEGPGIPIDIFHDMPDQTLKLETIPPNLYGLDPYRWVRHKRRSLMEGADFSGSYQYSHKTQKNKAVLFAFFQICPSLIALFQQLEQLPNPLQGVYAFALEQVAIYHQLHLALSSNPKKWLLAVQFEKNGRMRHTVIQDDCFVLSRLFQPLGSSQTPLSQEENRIREIQGTLRYLMKQFSISSVDIQAIFWGDSLSPQALNHITEQEHWILTPAQSALLLNFPSALPDFETFFLTWFYSSSPSAFLCLKPRNKQKAFQSFKQGYWVLAWCLGITLCISTGIFFYRAITSRIKLGFYRNN